MSTLPKNYLDLDIVKKELGDWDLVTETFLR